MTADAFQHCRARDSIPLGADSFFSNDSLACPGLLRPSLSRRICATVSTAKQRPVRSRVQFQVVRTSASRSSLVRIIRRGSSRHVKCNSAKSTLLQATYALRYAQYADDIRRSPRTVRNRGNVRASLISGPLAVPHGFRRACAQRHSVRQGNNVQSAQMLLKNAGGIGLIMGGLQATKSSYATQAMHMWRHVCPRSAVAASFVRIQVQVVQFRGMSTRMANPNAKARRGCGENSRNQSACSTIVHAEPDKVGCGWQSQHLSSMKQLLRMTIRRLKGHIEAQPIGGHTD